MRKRIEVYNIEKDVPVGGSVGLPPLGDLAVGESVLFALDKRDSVQTRASKLKREHGKEFTVKKVNEEHARVWRTK